MEEGVILARFNPVALPEPKGNSGHETLPDVLMVMPAGVHTINAHLGEKGVRVTVRVDEGTAGTLQEVLKGHQARQGKKAYFDFDHQESAAAAWPQEFFFASAPEAGVYARVEWSSEGAAAVRGKVFRSFSPAFVVDRHVADERNPARVTGAPLVMGGLVNDPAFGAMKPLWARQADGTGGNGENGGGRDLAGAAGNNNKNKGEDGMEIKEQELAALKAKEAELVEENRKVSEQVRAKEAIIANLQESIKAHSKKVAQEAIKAAVKRGALPAADEALQAKYQALIENDPSNVVLVESLPGNAALAEAITAGRAQVSGRVEVGQEDPVILCRAYGAEKDAMKRGVLYARSGLRKLMEREEGFDHVIRAADTLVGTLITQRCLDLLRIEFPQLSRISTNFSGENLAYGETVNTRLVTVPTVGTYHTTNGYVGAAGAATDVPVLIDTHKFVQIQHNANDIAGTRRLLFGEKEQAMHYALGKDLVDAIYALFTTGNYTETPTTEALVDFDRTSVIDIGIAMQTGSAGRNANTGVRTLLLSSAYYGKLAEDTVIVGNLNNAQSGGAISSGVLPMVHGFLPVEAPNLPTTGNLTGFGMRADAVALAVRPANDYANAQPGLPATGVLEQVTNPDTGLTVSLARFVDHYKGMSYFRLAWMYGAKVGNLKAGQFLRSSA